MFAKMFAKTMIVLSAALVLGTAYASVATAKTAPRTHTVQPYSSFEKLWFSIPAGEQG
jgi:hypothetical protein